MVEIGRFNTLKVVNATAIGVYLDAGTDDQKDNILLPNNQLPEDEVREGDELEVFIYRDSKDRLIATRKKPLAQVGDMAYLRVVETSEIGAFLDWGLEKDLFLPFGEQKYKVQEGRSYLVRLYIDKSGRISSTTDIEKYLTTDSPYKNGDQVTGTVYQVKKEMGAFIAVDNQYVGLIPKNEYFHDLRNGDVVEARVVEAREDGKLTLSPRKAAYKQMNTDAEILLEMLEKKNGFIPLNDNSSPEQIKYHLNMSKAAFKRAIGALLKQGKVEQTEDGLRLK
jgi:predicted RNA-binding protein (virulence factor B family)